MAHLFTPSSFGLANYSELSEWGSFGIAKPGHFSHPQFIAVDSDGSIFVSDLGNKRIQKFSSDGQYIADWGKSGKQPGEFHYPSGIAVSDEFVYVADRDLNRIQKFTTDGKFVLEWGTKGIYEGQLYFPNGVAVYNGTVYVVDTGNHRVQAFSSSGEFIKTIGSSGLGSGQFLTAIGIDIDSDGNIYVTDKGNGKIEKFNSDGIFEKSFAFYSSNYQFVPEAIAVDMKGDMFVINTGNSKILHLSQNSSMYLDIFEKNGPYMNSFGTITDIAIGINGELLAVDSLNHEIKTLKTPFYVKPKIIEKVVLPALPVEIVKTPSYDKIKPKIYAPISITVEATDLFTLVSFGQATATDQSGIKDVTHNAPKRFKPGMTAITWIAFDNVGHSASTNQTITVQTCGNSSSDYNLIEGTNGDDILQGTDGNDLIFGLSGNDLISGGLGDDCIFGGFGDDVISGDAGNDTIKGNFGNDILKGQSGTDILYSGDGSDVLDGGIGSDRCYSSDSSGDISLSCEG